MTTVKYSVLNPKYGSEVGMYDRHRAEELRDEWNKLNRAANGDEPHVIVAYQEVPVPGVES